MYPWHFLRKMITSIILYSLVSSLVLIKFIFTEKKGFSRDFQYSTNTHTKFPVAVYESRIHALSSDLPEIFLPPWWPLYERHAMRDMTLITTAGESWSP